MTQYVDYSKLSRRELQALCKQHKIQANKTNVFMAESLDALLNNAPRQQEEFEEEELPAPPSPEVETVVERVRGKRATQKTLVVEAELDSLAGLLASSSLEPQSEKTEHAAEPERTSEEPEMGENILPLVVPTKGRRGRPRTTKKEEQVVVEPAAKPLEVDPNSAAVGEESMIEESEGWAKSLPEAVPEPVSSPLQAVPKSDDVELVEPAMVYVRSKNLARTQEKVTSEQIEAMDPEAVEEIESEMIAPYSEVATEEEEMVPEPIEEEMDTTLSPPEREEMVPEPIADEVERALPPPEEEKKARKPKRGGAKSRRNPEPEAEAEVEMPEEMVEVIESDRESTSATAELVSGVEKVSPPELSVDAEKDSPAPVEKKTRKPRKAGSKSRRNKEVEDVPEVESHDQVVPDAATYSMSGYPEGPKDAEAEKPSPWTFPTPVLEGVLPPSPIVLKEKPKARKSKKASTKARKNAEQPVAGSDDVCEESTAVEAAVDECNNEAVKEIAEPVTPVKRAVENSIADEKENEEKSALLNLSLRKLKETLKEKEKKKKALQSRGSNTRLKL